MEMRIAKKLNIETSLLGFGCMRLPMKDGVIDYAETERMLDAAWDAGVNYFDTAYVYHGGKSEGVMGPILKKHPRDKFYVADKMPVWLPKTPDDLDRIFNEQLERLGLDYIDFYLMHSMTTEHWADVQRLDMLRFAEKKRAEGKIKYIGFSFHDTPELFAEIVDAYDWDFAQIQYNYLDDKGQRAEELYKMLEDRGLFTVVMEPVRGGDLASLPDQAGNLLKQAAPDRSLASWALRYVGSKPGVNVILSGMSDPAQVRDNLQTFSHFDPLDKQERAVLAQAVDVLAQIPQIACTGCQYCMPCPVGVDIPGNFDFYNSIQKFGANPGRVRRWGMLDKKYDACVACGACLSKCPQHLAIPDELKKLADVAAALHG
ncbi:MAG: aldo/keto reductase [Ethanoligenens sp.]